MPATVVVGTQWGDEGKGKLTDLLAGEMDLVVRYQGGHNAGHRIVVDGEAFALQLVPSGVLYPHITPVIGNGVVVDPAVLLAEVDALGERGIDTSRLVVSGNAHLIMPYHQELDRVTERYLGKNSLGAHPGHPGVPRRDHHVVAAGQHPGQGVLAPTGTHHQDGHGDRPVTPLRTTRTARARGPRPPARRAPRPARPRRRRNRGRRWASRPAR